MTNPSFADKELVGDPPTAEDDTDNSQLLLPKLRGKVREDVRRAVRAELRAQEEPRPELPREDAGDRLLTKGDVAKRLKCSERTVDTLAAEGRLPKIKIGRLVRFHADAVDAFIRRCVNSE